MAELPDARGTIAKPAGFHFDEVRPSPRLTGPAPSAPDLGPLSHFTGDWTGSGFNTIFRPHQPGTPTGLPVDDQSVQATDNILELNLTSENLSFSASLGTVPNRGMVQGDALLNGVPYLQSISDVTTSPSVGIHLEPGLWMRVPSTVDPPEAPTLVRMASIPHGTTICAQGTSQDFLGTPTIPPVSLKASGSFGPTSSPPTGGFTFASQTATAQDTPRIPQDLTTFIASGRITQAMLDDPNSVLRSHNTGLTITGGTVISVSTAPASPLFGGGSDNIAFLCGTPSAVTAPAGSGQNGQAIQMNATFWIETVQHAIVIPPFHLGSPPLNLKPENALPSQPSPTFLVRPPRPILEPIHLTFESTQIQYSQLVFLNFNGLSWPHVSVATLVPAGPIPIPPSAW